MDIYAKVATKEISPFCFAGAAAGVDNQHVNFNRRSLSKRRSRGGRKKILWLCAGDIRSMPRDGKKIKKNQRKNRLRAANKSSSAHMHRQTDAHFPLSFRAQLDAIVSFFFYAQGHFTCAFEFRVEEVGQGFDAQSERGVTAGQVAVGGQRWAGSGVAAQEAGQPGQVTVAEPLIVREAEDSEATQRLEQIPRQWGQVVVIQRPEDFQSINSSLRMIM